MDQYDFEDLEVEVSDAVEALQNFKGLRKRVSDALEENQSEVERLEAQNEDLDVWLGNLDEVVEGLNTPDYRY